MFSKYKKGGSDEAPGAPELKSIPGGQDAPTTKPTSQQAPDASTEVATTRRNVSRTLSRIPGQVSPVDKERKRKERLGEIKLELHKRLLDNLNLAALDNATENDLRSEIVAISGEALDEIAMICVLRSLQFRAKRLTKWASF